MHAAILALWCLSLLLHRKSTSQQRYCYVTRSCLRLRMTCQFGTFPLENTALKPHKYQTIRLRGFLPAQTRLQGDCGYLKINKKSC